MLDIAPATRMLASLVRAVRDDQLDGRTPCGDTSLGALLVHVDGFCQAFTAAARKAPVTAGTSELGDDWRERLPQRLETLAEAWRDEDAWQGTTEAGGQTAPAEVLGVIALDEVVVHGWDVAVASGQRFTCDDDLLLAVHGFVQATVAEHPDGTPGLFGPPVPVAADRPLLDRLVGLTGRDPAWKP